MAKEIEQRRKKEIDFYEQFWIIFNPDNNETIKADLISEVFKILYSPISTSSREIISDLKQFYKIAFFQFENKEDDKKFISPITGQEITDNDIWDLDKLVKEFLELKKISLIE